MIKKITVKKLVKQESAIKRANQAIAKKMRNQSRLSEIKTVTKKFLEAVATSNTVAAQELLRVAESKIARAKSKSVLKSNTASRKISKLAKALSSLSKQ